MDLAHILIVDDEDIARKNLSRILQKEGFEVATAKTGSMALERLAESTYDLVMTDLVMEDVNGLELLTRIKNQFPDIEVILITGYASIPTAIEALIITSKNPFDPMKWCTWPGRQLRKSGFESKL
jgi:DNA-binding NtrC family response regulator